MSAEIAESVDCGKVAELAVDLWRIRSRAVAESASDRVIAACERAEDRMRRMGFETETLAGLFDPNQRARVVDHEESDGPLEIAACLTPAVSFKGEMVREAEIVTRGGGQKDG